MVIQILIPWGLVLLFLHLTLAEPFRLKARAVNDGVTDLSRRSRPFHPSAQQRSHSTPGSNEDFELLDTVLVASVDGKFHALNRTNGHIQWSMPDDPISSTDTPLLQHLVRTDHGSLAQPDIHSDPSDIDETYVIEPQTGDIFVLPSTSTPDTTPLQRLTYSMPQLVELSPFRFATDDQRVFVGRKETSMITLDLDTGRVISVFNSDKCFWPESENAQESNNSEYVLDEEELYMLNRPPSTGVREVHIGRTDYHVAVHVRGRGVIQNLAFSAYGPNNIDRDNQLDWTDTPDSRYLQPLPDGTVLSFDFKRERDPLRWSNQFIHPIVAVFDILSSPSRPLNHPIALLQPRPLLEQLFSSDPKKLEDLASIPEKTHIGVIGNSLFAMSHLSYPLVTFSEVEKPKRQTIGTGEEGEGVWEEEGCKGLLCFVGTHLSQSAAGTRLSRLIEASADKSFLETSTGSSDKGEAETPTATSTSTDSVPPALPTWTPSLNLVLAHPLTFFGLRKDLAVLLFSSLMGILGVFGLGWKSVKARSKDIALGGVPSGEAYHGLEEIVLKPEPLPQIDIEPIASPISNASPTDQNELSREAEKSFRENGEGESERDDDGEGEAGTGLRKRRRRKRGKGKKGGAGRLNNNNNGDESMMEEEPESLGNGESWMMVEEKEVVPPPTISLPPVAPTVPPTIPLPSSLVVSDSVLGYGSHGTVVYGGSFQGRAVAVKRLLQDFVTLASREVELLQESDDHPNVIRYYYKENKDNFLYIALELCPASLEDVLSRPDTFKEISSSFDPKRAVSQITAGLRHLHSLKIVHRDIKPQNILISQTKNGANRMLISDFGLCKKLESDETSFLPTRHGPMGAGTVGWRAPEILRGEVKLDEQSVDVSTSTDGRDDSSTIGSVGTASGGPTAPRTRLTKSVDIFALGCLYYYTLSGGDHPYGGPFDREANILKNEKSLDWLDNLGEEGAEAVDLITQMLHPNPRERPDTTACLVHPFFWSPAQRLSFLQDASDRFEIMEREPPEEGLVSLESQAEDVVGLDWHRRLDKIFIDNLGKFRKYNGKSVQDLLRALRNKKHHYQDIPDNVKKHLGPLPDGFLAYFTRRFPRLFLHVYHVIEQSALQHESMFQSYFKLGDT